ncbi:C-type lectin domain family 4 member G-like isoform X1 [Mustela lutreola]|uniref:C-type lectin domain family 4 member G-like isoform X1 n=1 Tax=Mustela lutreola TaxID=9666 RepID=UPI00279707DE|nr:C-type lectin domain family 4 member G-like isoform X1 [Mustela lutreola]
MGMGDHMDPGPQICSPEKRTLEGWGREGSLGGDWTVLLDSVILERNFLLCLSLQFGEWEQNCVSKSLVHISHVFPLVLQFFNQMQEELKQLDIKFVQGLADAGHKRDMMWGEVFRQMEALRAGNESSCEPCLENWMAFQGSCYLFSTQSQDWFEAKDHCAKKGAHLVIINSQAEQKFLISEENTVYWIGLKKQYPKGIYKWQDGSAPTFINWPDTTSSDNDCVFIEKSGFWFSGMCQVSWYYICEKPQVC